MSKLIIRDDIDYKFGYPKPPDKPLILSEPINMKSALLSTDFKLATWSFTIKSIILWSLAPIIIPICIILSKVMKKEIDIFKY